MNTTTKVLSFSSAKGGVGRTMTLANCAKIYSKGVTWTGIIPSTTLLVDLDFNAPGIHYYDFADQEENKIYKIGNRNFSCFSKIQTELDKNNIGIAFLLNDLINNRAYKNKCDETIKLLKKQNESAIESFQNYVFELFENKQYNPLNHLIQFSPGPLYVLPAGSPNNSRYCEIIFGFEWLDFINNYLGVYLIDCVISKLIDNIKDLENNTSKPVRVLLDQQAGMSVSAALNRSLADAHLLIGGFNEQNKAGLKALVKNYYDAYIDNDPWIVLNQYNFRDMVFQRSSNISNQTAHELFNKIDKINRLDYISSFVDQHANLKERVFVTEFVDDAIQKEHFYKDDEISTNELVQLLVSIEKRFESNIKVQSSGSNEVIQRLVFIGEIVESNHDYSGPLNGLNELLKLHFKDAEIIALAARHEDIVELVKNRQIKISIKKDADKISSKNISELAAGVYNVTKDNESELLLNINELDLISYPYYLVNHLLDNDDIILKSEDGFVQNVAVEDSLIGATCEYYKQNILRWNQYSYHEEKNTVVGVPLFVNFQLLAYRKDYSTNQTELADKFRKQFHRLFEGFRNPDDILKYAELTFPKNDNLNSVLLCGNTENIAMWYEWQTILSMFFYKNHDNIKESKSYDDYIKFILESLDATLMYVKLRKLTEQVGESYDWDTLIRNFYFSKENSLIFIWPDAIPKIVRTKDEFVYQVPPSFHFFEESWLLSVVKKGEPEKFIDNKFYFLNKYLTPEYQKIYVHNGGLPIHKTIFTSLDLWREYSFIPPLWSVYYNRKGEKILNKRESFSGIYELGKKISKILDQVIKQIDVNKLNDKDLIKELEELIKSKLEE